MGINSVSSKKLHEFESVCVGGGVGGTLRIGLKLRM